MITYFLTISIFFWLFLAFFGVDYLFLKNPFFGQTKFCLGQDQKKITSLLLKVKIIIPARNEERNICKTLRKLINQVGVNYFIIIVDDNSTDSTTDIAKKF